MDREGKTHYLMYCKHLFEEFYELVKVDRKKPLNEWTDEELENAVGVMQVFIEKLKAAK